ncbi:MAG: UPF0182 family protein [Methanomicrobiales archaeon]|nr:UPF0182 family protein [Methanomicrobiales archaeon]
MKRSSLPGIAVVLLVLLIIGITAGIALLADWYWFSAVGYPAVFTAILGARILLWLIGFVIFFGVLFGNAAFAARRAAHPNPVDRSRLAPLALAAGFIGLLSGFGFAGAWETVLRFLHQAPFSVADPLFGLDVGFFVFSLPFYVLVIDAAILLLVLSVVLAALAAALQTVGLVIRMNRFGRADIESEGIFDWPRYISRFLPQLNGLLFLLFVALAVRVWFARFNLVYATTGVVFGAGYTDVHVTLPALSILALVSAVIGIGFLVNEKYRRVEVITYGIGAFVAVAVIGLIAGGVMQALVVEPDESNLERPYLENNINSTLAAYGLDSAREQLFFVNYSLSAEDIEANSATVENIRLWDWRPLKTTYEQLQLFRTYYAFNDVDVDRYAIAGRTREVLVSAREMNSDNLPLQAQTWVNRHLVYTHGFGVVMNPVDAVTGEGLPEFYIRDIPPASPYLALDEPRIYYGELTGDYAVVRTATDELDYPAGEQNIYASYSGTGGVSLSGSLARLVYAIRFGSVELLVSGSLEPESRILLHREISDRVATIAPFLTYDADPYVVIADGKLYWIGDAYTASDRYPYSEPVYTGGGETLNYVRNSVKVVVDAYNGDIRYYVIDPSDPVIRTYQAIFPDLFLPFSAMPEELAGHIRYPQGLFEIQANLYAVYHMKDPRVFYNQEDAWVIPEEVYRGSRQRMEPYYVIMKLPGEEAEEFILMLPFTPRNKENMIGWMAARSDRPHYGELIVYQFSKQELTYGPLQIEARIDQDTDISQLITLWSQSGSRVLRGNTLVIPIQSSILYVEPLYLEATEKGTLPQLQRVIVAYDDRLTMQETLAEALEVIFGSGAGAEPPGGDAVPPISETDREKLERIADLYDRAQRALAAGDLGLYQQYVDAIGKVVAE